MLPQIHSDYWFCKPTVHKSSEALLYSCTCSGPEHTSTPKGITYFNCGLRVWFEKPQERGEDGRPNGSGPFGVRGPDGEPGAQERLEGGGHFRGDQEGGILS